MARSFGADLVLLHVIPELNYPLRSFGMASSFPHMQAELHQRADEELLKEKERVGNGLRVQVLVRNGEVHVQVLEAAKDVHADLVVMGTHGHPGLKHAVLGSTAERVVRLCPCPVLTVRPHAGDPS
jgi:nucleotide-binding universal stress UspA family protein